MSDSDYRTDMRIDDQMLDIEWEDQPELAMKYGRIWADAHKRLQQAEERVKIVRSELIKEVNEDPVKCTGKEKPTVTDIEAYYRTHERHIEAKKEWIEAEYECNMAEIAKNEVSFTRKAALENLVILLGQDYFAGPKVPHDLNFIRKKRSTPEITYTRTK